MRSSIRSSVISGLIVSTIAFGIARGVDAAQPPNIIIFLADDFGYGDLACTGHPYAKTPSIDRLAHEGAMFNQHYATGVTCCPSRTGLMTGRHPASFEKYPAEHDFSGRATITELLNKHGYRTGHFGKWHIGNKSTEIDGMYGIDEVGVIGDSKDSLGRDDDLTSAAIEFIKSNAKGPFYVNIWGHSTHFAVKDNPEVAKLFDDIEFSRTDFPDYMQEKFDESEALVPDLANSLRQYLADVYTMDRNVGRVLEALDELGIADNTIMVFSSDQGPAPVVLGKGTRPYSQNMLGYAGGLRGGKHTQWEGGVRIPFIIRWPGHIKAGRVDDESVTSFIDWLPTLCSITGIKQLPEGLEGEDVSDIWLKGPRERKTTLYWKVSSPNSGISLRKDQWKFHESKEGPLLYDLKKDAGEKINIADKFPEVTEKLVAAANDWRGELPKSYDKGEQTGNETKKPKQRKKKAEADD